MPWKPLKDDCIGRFVVAASAWITSGPAGAVVTTAVAALAAGVEGPPAFDAMTTTRNVEPASPATTA